MNRFVIHAAAGAAALAGLLTIAPSDAAAEVRIGLDGEFAVPTNDGLRSAEGGPHFGVRLGYAFPTPLVDLVLEARGTTINFPSELKEEPDGWGGFGVLGGVRVGLSLGLVRPALFAHAGYGQTEVEGSDYNELDAGYLVDGGLAVTFTGLPYVGIGGHVAYNALVEAEQSNTSLPRTDQWISFGLHLELRL